MGLVEDQVVEAGAVEEFPILLAREQQFELFHIREQDPRLPPRRPHRFPGTHLLRRIDRLAAPFLPGANEPRLVVRPGGARTQASPGDLVLPLRRLPDVEPEGNPGPGEQSAEAHHLVLGERVHRIHDDRADARRRALVPQFEAAADDRIEEALRLAGTGSRRNERRPPGGDCPDRPLLVPVEPLHRLRDPLLQVRMEQPFVREFGDPRPLPEGPRQAQERPRDERRPPRLVQRQQFPHLPVQVRRGEGVRGELIPEETREHLLGVRNGVQRHISDRLGVSLSRRL